ncbi:MAG: ATP-binding protein [Acidaminococcaceae bacterium]
MNCYANLNNLLIYRNLLEDPLILALKKPKEVFEPELHGELILRAEEYGLMGIIPVEYIMHAISHQENIFCAMAEKNNGKIGDGLAKAVAQDISILRLFLSDVFTRFKNHPLFGNYVPSKIKPLAGRKVLETVFFNFGEDENGERATKELCAYYAKFGYGLMADFVTFHWDGKHGCLAGTQNHSEITFSKIYGYERQKQELICNTEAFIQGKPANNVLLFGDRGTGKSSSIKALGNHFYAEGLRLVQVSREDFQQLPQVLQALSRWGKKFIIVLDDLSFEEFEVEYKTLKSILDGGLEVKPSNVLFCATSNRRNIVQEVWQEQKLKEVHCSDSMNEKISLADRFGIKLFYDSMDQKAYFTMLEKIALEEELVLPVEELHAEAVKWEMSHTGRNGRMARQLLDYLQGKQ